jgi:hypothetical protein
MNINTNSNISLGEITKQSFYNSDKNQQIFGKDLSYS